MLAFPPCPTCGGEVTNLVAKGGVEDRRIGRLEVAVWQAIDPFSLAPCGHEVRGYVSDASGVTAWADAPVIDVRKHSSVVQVPRNIAIDYGLVEPTPAERAEREVWHVEWEQRKQAATEAAAVFAAALAAVADPVARAVLDLHKPADHGHCHGCDADGYEWEYPEWPCRTATTIAATLGIDVPPDLDLATIADNG